MKNPRTLAIVAILVGISLTTGCTNQSTYRGAGADANRSVQYTARSNADGTQEVQWVCDAGFFGDRACAEMAKSHTSHTNVMAPMPDPFAVGKRAAERAAEAVR